MAQRNRIAEEAAARWLRHLDHTIQIMEMAWEIGNQKDPVVIVAGIEGRAIVRAGMQRELRYIGEVQ